MDILDTETLLHGIHETRIPCGRMEGKEAGMLNIREAYSLYTKKTAMFMFHYRTLLDDIQIALSITHVFFCSEIFTKVLLELLDKVNH
uniref:Uncharacterized protein n=1 Tax=Steinernema glaseri TaxID=37863 RepID=A0A1I7YP35_9BILA